MLVFISLMGKAGPERGVTARSSQSWGWDPGRRTWAGSGPWPPASARGEARSLEGRTARLKCIPAGWLRGRKAVNTWLSREAKVTGTLGGALALPRGGEERGQVSGDHKNRKTTLPSP